MIRRPFTSILLAISAVAFSGLLGAAEPAENPLQRAQAMATGGDMKGAIELLKNAAEKGSAEAANALGELHLLGQGVTASPVEAARWFQQAADASYPLAMVNLGMLLLKAARASQPIPTRRNSSSAPRLRKASRLRKC